MATYKKATKKTAARRSAGSDVEQQAERLARSLGESAQQVWLAGIGALGRAQSEGSRLFDSLVEEGEHLEREARESAGNRASEVMQAVGSSVDDARAFAGGTWDRWEKAFDERMQRALGRLGVPGRDEIARLNRQVEELTAELRRQGRATAPRKTPVRKAGVKKATIKKSAATKAVAPGAKAPARAATKAPAKRGGPTSPIG